MRATIATEADPSNVRWAARARGRGTGGKGMGTGQGNLLFSAPCPSGRSRVLLYMRIAKSRSVSSRVDGARAAIPRGRAGTASSTHGFWIGPPSATLCVSSPLCDRSSARQPVQHTAERGRNAEQPRVIGDCGGQSARRPFRPPSPAKYCSTIRIKSRTGHRFSKVTGRRRITAGVRNERGVHGSRPRRRARAPPRRRVAAASIRAGCDPPAHNAAVFKKWNRAGGCLIF